MLKFLITLFVIASGFTAAEESCNGHVSFVCAPPEPQPPFPKTAEGLKEVCDILIRSFECGVDFEQRCNTEPGYIARSINVLSVLREMCTEDTLLHGVVVDNLGCFEEILMVPNECYSNPPDQPDDETMKLQAEELLKEGLDTLGEDSEGDKYKCLRDVNQLACQAVLIENKCGTVAMDAYNQIVKVALPAISGCGEKFSEMLSAVIRLRKRANEFEEALEERKK